MIKIPIFIYLLVIWGIFNYMIAFYEYYIYVNRNQLELSSSSFWQNITSDNLLIRSWNEYLKVDSRYLTHNYVWIFELINIVLAWIFIFLLAVLSLILNVPNLESCGIWYALRLILILQAINCILYFLTLILDWSSISPDKRKYSKWWHYFIYYTISAIWIIIPLYLSYFLTRSISK